MAEDSHVKALEEECDRLRTALDNARDKSEPSSAESLSTYVSRLEAVINTAPDGVVTIDENGTIEDFNPAAQHMFGYDEAEVLGHNVSMLMPRRHATQHDSYIARYIKTGEPRIIGIGRVLEGRHKDGSQFPIHLTVGEVERNDRRLFTGFIEDLREITSKERQIDELQQELYRVARLGDLGEMASGIAHELNQPLAAMMNFAEAGLALAKRSEGLPAKSIDLFQKSIDQAERAGEIIRRMRQLIGRNEVELQLTDVNALVRDAANLALIGSSEKNIQARWSLAEALPPALADRTQIQQVVFNLIRNSIDAMAHEGGELTIATGLANGEIKVAISDTGPGLAPEIVDKLFMPFATTKADGMGIGLAICKSIVEAHGGTIRATPSPSHGVTFEFTLEREPDHEAIPT